MKILIIGPYFQNHGGISAVIANIINNKDLSKHKIDYLSTNFGKSKFRKSLSFIKFLLIFLVFLITKQIDIIHIHSSTRASFLRKSIIIIISKIFNKKIIFQLHSGEFYFNYKKSSPIFQYYVRLILNSSSCCLALGDSSKKQLAKICKKKIYIINNPITIEKSIKKFSNTIPKILFLASLNKNKGIYDLIDAVDSLSKKFEFELLICGDGEIKKVSEKIKNKKLNKKVIMLGWVSGEKKKNILLSSDIFVLPSYYEVQPICVLEAMSFKMPIIASDVGSVSEEVINGYNGFLIKPGDINDLINKIKILLNNPKKRISMGNNSYLLVKEKFGIKKVIKRLDEIYINC